MPFPEQVHKSPSSAGERWGQPNFYELAGRLLKGYRKFTYVWVPMPRDGLGSETILFTNCIKTPTMDHTLQREPSSHGKERILSLGCSLALSGSICIIFQPEKVAGRRRERVYLERRID